MLNDNEQKVFTTQASLGNGIQVEFKAVKDKGYPLADTQVSIGGQVLCAITWEERFHFISELEAVIDKYKI
jgi:hypothetical protein